MLGKSRECHFPKRVEVEQEVFVHVQKAVALGHKVDAAFLWSLENKVCTANTARYVPCGVLLVHHAGLGSVDIEVFLAHIEQDRNVLFCHHVSLAKHWALVLAGNDAGDVLTEDGAHSVLHGYGFHGKAHHNSFKGDSPALAFPDTNFKKTCILRSGKGYGCFPYKYM